MALLLANTLSEEIEERQGEEREVGVRRKRLGAGSEREVRRAVGREVLSASKVRSRSSVQLRINGIDRSWWFTAAGVL